VVYIQCESYVMNLQNTNSNQVIYFVLKFYPIREDSFGSFKFYLKGRGNISCIISDILIIIKRYSVNNKITCHMININIILHVDTTIELFHHLSLHKNYKAEQFIIR